MEYIIKNKKAVKLLKDRAPLIEEGREISKQIDELTERRNKLALKAQKIQDQITKFVEEEIYPELPEFEYIQNVELRDDKAIATSYNHLDLLKQNAIEKWNKEIKRT